MSFQFQFSSRKISLFQALDAVPNAPSIVVNAFLAAIMDSASSLVSYSVVF